MDTFYEAYDRAREFYDIVRLFIPQSIIYSLNHFYAQSSRLLHTLVTSPSNIQNEGPAILSTLFLAFSIYLTIISTIRAMRTAFSVGFFVMKYATIFATILSLVGMLYPNQDQSMGAPTNNSILGIVGRNIISGWHALTRPIANQYSNTYRRSPRSTTYSQRTPRKERSKQSWEKFDPYSPLSPDTRSNAKKRPNIRSKDTESNLRRPLQEGNRRWWQGDNIADGESPLITSIINWAVQRAWNYEGIDWSDLGSELPESIRNSWDDFNVEFTGSHTKKKIPRM